MPHLGTALAWRTGGWVGHRKAKKMPLMLTATALARERLPRVLGATLAERANQRRAATSAAAIGRAV
jgi:hypothetical protein